MMNKTILMLSASCMSIIAGADLCYADFNHFDTSPSFIPAGVKSHVSTHTSHLTAGHLSSLEDFAELTLPENSGNYLFYPLPKDLGRGRGGFHNIPLTQLAAACFVTDTTNCSGNEFANADSDENDGGVPPGGDDYDLDNAERCKKEGYNKTSCLPGEVPANFCPYDSNYFEKCTCPDGYKTCTPPYYGVGTACGNKYASCEKDTERACKEENPDYITSCPSGQQFSSDRCSYDSSYGICCNTCAGYPYTADTIPEGYVQDGESCTGCDGQEHYKIKPNPCDGFMDCGSAGPASGANFCLSGTTTMYDNCKPCPNLGTLTSCPSPYTCTYEECSNRYYKTGCQSGYDWNEKTKTCTSQCPSNYRYTCDGPHEIGSGSSCNDKYRNCTCERGYTWSGGKCINKDYQQDCDGLYEVGVGSPVDGKYKSCSCSEPCYEWTSSGGCENDYIYDCSGFHITGGSGSSCGGKYQSCSCESGYEWTNGRCDNQCRSYEIWDGSQCICPSIFKYTCNRPNESWCTITSSNETYEGSCTPYKEAYEKYGIVSCQSKYPSCECDYGYEWDSEQGCIEITDCRIGSILYSDKTCTMNWKSTKTPIGVVVYSSSLGHGQALAWDAPKGGDWKVWGGWGIDIPNLPNMSNSRNDFNSCENTAAIMAAGDSSTYPAAWAAHNYSSTGTSVGDWCLPASGIIGSIRDNIDVINRALTGENKIDPSYAEEYMCSSTENDEYKFWAGDNRGVFSLLKGKNCYVRPVIEF